MGAKLEFAVAILNGLVGDYLEREGNGLATEMGLYRELRRVEPERADLARAYPDATPRVALFVHGVCCAETIWRFPDGDDYGRRLARERGITPLYLRYNSGRSIAENGRDLADLLQRVSEAYPLALERLLLVGYSMGGLLLRSACHFAAEQGLPWLERVERAIYIGTPHAGAPAERVGRLAARLLRAIPDPYTRLVAELGDLRSAGIKDLGDADLRDEDRASLSGRLSLRDRRHPLPLLPRFPHFLLAGSLKMPAPVASLFGDAVVPLSSATAERMLETEQLALPADHVRVLPGRTHVALPRCEDAYRAILGWSDLDA
ncbi:MAG: esterase/lipase family protein [Planctomycetota bacterium]